MIEKIAYLRRMPPLPTTRDLLRLYKIKAKKSLSQNFIMDPRILTRFVKTAGKIEGGYAIEVGPGPGGITRAILEAGVKECHVIEKDPRFLTTLKLIQEAAGPNRLHINIGDCLTYNVTKMFSDEIRRDWNHHDVPPLTLFGNLPFNVATPFIIKLLRCMADQSNIYSFGRVTSVLTFQHEVALRMCTPAKHPQRSRLSVVCQNWANVHYAYQLPGGAFVPPPAVDVGIVKLTPLREPYINLPFKLVDQVVNAMFVSGKNRFIRSSLANVFNNHIHDQRERKALADELLKRCDIDPETSAIMLEMDEIRELCFGYKYLLENHPSLMTIGSTVLNLSYDEDVTIISDSETSKVMQSEAPAYTKYVVKF
jgi:dimethyladenosine transferase 1